MQTGLYPHSQIDIFISVQQQDDKLLAVCINTTTLALAAAGVPLHELVCAVSAGMYAAAPLLDFTALEDDLLHAKKVTLVSLEMCLPIDRFVVSDQQIYCVLRSCMYLHHEIHSCSYPGNEQ